MSLYKEKLDKVGSLHQTKNKKWMKNQFIRFLRRFNKLEKPPTKYKKGWYW